MRLLLRTGLLLGLLLLATSLIFPHLFRGAYPHPPGPEFDRASLEFYRQEIELQKPEIVLLGDSMLTKGVERGTLERLTGASTYKLDIPGSSSALWYLVVKSNIVPAQHAPRLLVILFRDTLLTAATFRTTGPYFGLIDKFAGLQEPLLLERAYLAQLTPLQRGMEQYLPLYTYRDEIRESVDGGLRHGMPGLLGCDRDCADDASTRVLGDIQPDLSALSILQAEQAIYTPRQLDFAARVEGSFLPEIIRLAQGRGMQLVFVRAPTNIFPSPAAQPEGLEQYLTDLEAYLDAQGAPLIDLSRVKGIGPAQFVDPHHMTTEGKGIFTAVLAEALEKYLK